VTHLRAETAARARELVELYPEPRSALIPLCHLAQEQDGWLRPEAMEEIADLVGVTPAEVRGTATFYDMLHTEPVGRYLVSICTNIACLLGGAGELLEHAERSLGVRPGGTTADGAITLEEAECLADCDRTPCVTVNHRYVGGLTPETFDGLVSDLRAGRRDAEIPPHGTLVRVRRSGGLRVAREQIASERRQAAEAQAARVQAAKDRDAAAAGAAAEAGKGDRAPGAGAGAGASGGAGKPEGKGA
jgi:NADH-quinone oxidoreductase subunit E